MKLIIKKKEEGYGYSATMLPDYDGFIIIKPGFLKYKDEIVKDLKRRDFVVVDLEEKTLTKEELLDYPMGARIYRLCKKLRLMK